MKTKQIEKILDRISSRQMDAVLTIQNHMLKAISDFMFEKGIVQIMPVIVSPITDPLRHSVFDAQIEYYGQKLKLTKSMLMHKQISLIPKERKASYIVSPNIRLEKEEYNHTGRHLIEFSQVDFEFKDKKKEDVMRFMEELLIYVIKRVKKESKPELAYLGSKIEVPKTPFKVFQSKELRKLYGKDFEIAMSKKMKEPFWIIDHEREFYDKEDPEKPKTFLNYDLVYPYGFGEALSGGEREFEYERIIKRMKESKVDPTPYKYYLELAKRKVLPRTAGAGFGVERLLRYICGVKHIRDVALFAKVPGEEIVF